MTNFMLGVFEITVGMSLFIAVLLLCLKLFGGKFTAKCRYIIWALVMLRLAIPFSIGLLPTLIEIPIDTELVQSENLSSAPSKNTDPTTPSWPSDYGEVSVNPTVPSVNPATPGNTPILPEVPSESGDQAEPVIPSEPITETPTEQPISLNRILDIAGTVYFVGAAVFFVWSLVSYIIYTSKILSSAKAADDHTQKIFSNICKKYGIKKQPTLLVTSGIHSPAAFGIFHRRIVLPDIAFTDNGLVGTLAHEVTHCKRGDLYVKLVELIARSFYWFNPLVHIAAFQCEMEMELSCDEKVLSGSSEEARAAYADVMLDIIRRCRRNKGALTTHFNPKKSAVTARFKNILYGSGKRRGRILIGVCLVLCILAGAIVACQTDDLSDEHWYAEGYYLKCDNGSDVIVMDAEGANPASPCKMTVIDDSVSFEGLTDGDRIKIEISMIMTTYPGQTEVHSIEKLSDGTIDDIDPAVLDSLRELGWMDDDTSTPKELPNYLEIPEITLIQVDALPKGDSEALFQASPIGWDPTFFVFDDGLTFYVRRYYGLDLDESCYRATLTLPDGFTDGHLIYASRGGGSGEVDVFVKAENNGSEVFLRYYFTTFNYDEVVTPPQAAIALTENEVQNLLEVLDQIPLDHSYTSDVETFIPKDASSAPKITVLTNEKMVLTYETDAKLPLVYFGLVVDAESVRVAKTEFVNPGFEYTAYEVIDYLYESGYNVYATIRFTRTDGTQTDVYYYGYMAENTYGGSDHDYKWTVFSAEEANELNIARSQYDPAKHAELIPGDATQELFWLKTRSRCYYFCSIRTLNSTGTAYTDDPPKDFAIFYQQYDQNYLSVIDEPIPEEYPYDTIVPVLAVTGEGCYSMRCILRLTDGERTYYISYQAYEGIDQVYHPVSDDEVKALTNIYPEIFGEISEEKQTTEYNDDVLAQRYKPFSERVDFTPGDGSFFAERSDELAAAANAFLKEYENDKASSPPIMYYLVQKMGLSISEMYDYYCPGVSPDFVDYLFIEDMEEAKRALMADYSFYTDGKVYTFYEVYNAEMAGEPLFDITDSDHAAVLWDIYDYLTFQNKYGQQQQLGEYIPFVEEIITENFTTITDIADWETLGLSKEYSGAYSFLWELLSGESDIPEYNELGIKDYSLTRLFEINSPAETIEFTFTVTGNSLPETLPPGTYTKIVDEGVDVFLYDNKKPVENEEYTEINRVRMGFDKFGDIPAAQAVYWYVDWNYWKLSSYGQWEPERDLLPYGYICKFYGENLKIDFSELQQLMYDKFGIEVERPKESGYLHSKGICVYDKETDTAAYTDTRYFEPHHRIIDVKTENEITYVTVQLFADRLHLVPSHKIVYEIGADEVFLGCEIVEFGKYEPGELDLKSQG